MFVMLSVPVERDVASKLFYDQGSFERRINLVNFLVLKWNKPDEFHVWKSIQKKLHTHKGIRNLIAHQGSFRSSDEAGNQAVSLRASWLRKDGWGRELDARAIKATGDALTEISQDLRALMKRLKTT
jgi:hypothetical protein